MALLSSKFQKLQGTVYTLSRQGSSGSYVNGVWTPAATTNITRTLKIQPMKPSELAIFPEADRSRDWIKVYCNDGDLSEGDVSSKTRGDEFSYNGRNYRIMKIAEWPSDAVISHCKAFACRIDHLT